MRPSIRVGRPGRVVFAAVLTLSLAGCSPSGDIFDSAASGAGGPAGPSSLTSSASNPDSGNATLTLAAVLVLDADAGGFDELTLSQMTGETTHDVVVTWDTITHAIHGVSHVWGQGQSHGGPTSGFTACFEGINDCDPAKVAIDFDGHTVTLTGQVLDDVFGADSTSTLDGTVGW